VGFGIDLRARSRKPRTGLRALLGGKPPDAREVGERLVRLARRTFRGQIIDATPRRLTLRLHPAAPPVRLAVLPDGELELRADTTAIGPGYHAEVLARLAPLIEEIEYVLDDAPGDPIADMTAWLATELREGARLISMPTDRCFVVDAPVLTAMGPRDEAWREAVLAEPTRGLDAFAWPRRGRGREALSRALLAMWLDVPWREPLDEDERALLERVDADLAEAWRADDQLALPWAAWSELLDWLGADDAHARDVRRRAGTARSEIGYRRYAMDIELSGGWVIELGGAYVGRWDDDTTRWWATDGDRVVEFTSLTARDETDSDRLLEVAPALHPVIERFADGRRRGRAERYEEEGVHIVHGIMTCAPHVAILTCKGSATDEAWALDTWRSLRNL
jgi:hypothetical protein